MKKINVKPLKADVQDKLTRGQLKNVFGGNVMLTICDRVVAACWNYNCTGDAKSDGKGGWVCCGPKCE